MKASNNFSHKKIFLLSAVLMIILFSCSIFRKKQIKIFTSKQNVNFPDYQKLFQQGTSVEKIDLLVEEAIKKNKDLDDSEEGGELAEYSRWRRFWIGRQTRGASRRTGPQQYLQSLMEFSEEKICKGSGNWKLIGPTKAPTHNGVELHTMGAVFAVAADPNDLNVVYAGTGSAGIWKTTSALSSTPHWENITDYLNLPTLGVQDIVLNPLNNKTIYAATSSMRAGYGLGIIKSYDRGNTWGATGLTFSPSDLSVLEKILINPIDTNILFTHSDRKLFYSTNSGTDWSIAHDLGEIEKHERFRSLEFNLSNHDIVYAGATKILKYNRISDEVEQLDLLASFSTAPDAPSGYFYNDIFSTELSSSTNGCYALIKWEYKNLNPNGNPSHKYKQEIKKYTESTNSWESINDDVSSFAEIFIVNPFNSDIMYFGDASGRVIRKSINGAETFFLPNITKYWADQPYYGVSTHADIRALKLLSNSTDGLSDILLTGSDGGIMLSQSAVAINSTTHKVNWKNINGKGLAITEYFGLGGNEANPYLIHGGTQDNGIMTVNLSDWNNYIRGDAYDCIIDRNNSILGYGQMNYPNLRITSDKGQTWNNLNTTDLDYCNPNGNSWSFPDWWQITKWPLMIDNENILYVGHYDLFKYTESGGVWSWEPVSNFSSLPTSTFPYPCPSDGPIEGIATKNGSNLIAVDISKIDNNIICAAFTNPTWNCPEQHAGKHRLFRTTDGGDNWSDITPSDASKWLGITDVITDYDQPEKIWVTFDRLGGDEFHRVNYSPDGGSTWENWSTGLPLFPVNCIEYQEGSDDLLYVGTDVGVYYREGGNSSTPWQCFNSNLPSTLVTDLEINYCAQKIRAATFGRGLWESPLANNNSIAIDDMDGDGICDAGDQCPGFDDNMIGTPCDDGDNCTINDTYDSNCNCVGEPFGSFNLMIRDNPTDNGDEPNIGDIWNGNIWNCANDLNLNCSTMENPEYKTAGINRVRVRVDNIGCVANTDGEAKLHIYWTIGRAGELWTEHWFDATIEPNNKIPPSIGVSAGGEISPSAGIPIPPIPAGGSIVLNWDWTPPNPADFNSIDSEPMICFLARIKSTIDPIEGESIGPIAGNVRNSNNVATVNTTLVDIDPLNLVFPTHTFFLNNPYQRDVSLNVNIQELNSKDEQFFQDGRIEMVLDKVGKRETNYKPIKIGVKNLEDLRRLNNLKLKPNEVWQAKFKFIHSGKITNQGMNKYSSFKLKVINEYDMEKPINTEFVFDIRVRNTK
ncbi:MAG: hypothetical protein MI974_17570 [Chitinophagales bacterium]|nr:hypothetical protein [Chitinophagales bacterium]